MRFVIVGLLYNAEIAEATTRELKGNGHLVDFFPMLYYARSENKNQLIPALNLLLDNVPHNDLVSIDSHAKSKPDVFIWFYYHSSIEAFEFVKKNNIVNVLINMNDPFEVQHNTHETQLDLKAPYLDIVFTSSKKSMSIYKTSGATHVYHLIPAYDSTIYNADKILKENEYVNDVCLVVGGLHENNDIGTDRKKLLNQLTQAITSYNLSINSRENSSDKSTDNSSDNSTNNSTDKNNLPPQHSSIRLKIYGPKYLNELYPEFYGGFLAYKDFFEVYHKSKLVICTHRILEEDCFNRAVIGAMGSHTLVLMDHNENTSSIFEVNKHYVPLNLTKSFDQIKEILTNYSTYESIKNEAYSRVKSMHKWKNLIADVLSKLIKNYFTHEKLYSIEKTNIAEIYDKYIISSEIDGLFNLMQLEPNFIPLATSKFNELSLAHDIDINSLIEKFVYNKRKNRICAELS